MNKVYHYFYSQQQADWFSTLTYIKDEKKWCKTESGYLAVYTLELVTETKEEPEIPLLFKEYEDYMYLGIGEFSHVVGYH